MRPSTSTETGATLLCVASLLLALAAAPSHAEPSADPPPGALLAELPFEEDADPRHIVIDLAPPDYKRRFPIQLDTGATMTFLTPRTAKALGVSVRPHKSSPYRRKTVLGRDVQFWVNTRRSDTAATGGGFEYGLLGGEFLSHYVVELDFRARRVRFYDPDRYAVPVETDAPGEVVMPMLLVSNRPAVEAHVNGKPLGLLLDTGAPLTLLLSGELAESVGIGSKPIPGFRLSSVAGPLEVEGGVAERVAFGPLAFDAVNTAVAPHGVMNYGFAGDSIIGYDLMAQFLVRLDYPHRRVFFRRDPEARLVFEGDHPQARIDVAAAPEPPNADPETAPQMRELSVEGDPSAEAAEE